MKTYFKLMHSRTSRVIRLFGGLWLVIYAAQQTPAFAFTVALVGTAIAVTGIADICPMELIVNATRNRSRPTRRAA